MIHRGNLAEIWRLSVAAAIRLRRSVRRVRIEIVHPHEPGRGSGALCSSASAAWSSPPRTARTLPEAGCRRRCRIHAPVRTGVRARSSRRTQWCDSPPSQLLGDDRVRRRESARILVDTVTRRIEPRHDRRVRRQRFRNGRVRLGVNTATRGQRVERRCVDACCAGPIESARVVSRVTRRIDGSGWVVRAGAGLAATSARCRKGRAQPAPRAQCPSYSSRRII